MFLFTCGIYSCLHCVCRDQNKEKLVDRSLTLNQEMGLKPWEIITKHKLKWCPRARLTNHIKFLSVVFLIFLLCYGVYFMLKRKLTSTWRQKEDSQKFIVSKMTGQHFTGNILWPAMINMVGHVRWPDVISTPVYVFILHHFCYFQENKKP